MLYLLASLFSFVVGQDSLGSTGCSAAVCVLANSNLRFGSGAETSINTWGLFQQPWYFSRIANSWYKLTFANYPLDTAIGMGTGSPSWSGAYVTDLYTLTPSSSTNDYSNFTVLSSDATKSVGYGVIVSKRIFTISGQQITLQNTFSLGRNDSFVKVTVRVTNNSPNTLQNFLIWVGTRDDFVGTTDVNTKTRGNLDTGSFLAVTANNQSSRAIMITNPTEGVLFYSETTGVMTSYASCCSFSNVYNTNPLTLAPATLNPTDGSYAAVLPLGNVTSNSSETITWYYAAGAISSLTAVAQSVAVDQVISVGGVSFSSTPSITASITGSGTPSVTGSQTPSVTGSGTPSVTGSQTPSITSSQTSSLTSSQTSSITDSETPSITSSQTSSITGSGTPSVTITGTQTDTSSITSTQTPSSTSSFAIRFIMVRDQGPIIIEKTSTDTNIFLYVFVPINVALIVAFGVYSVWKCSKERVVNTGWADSRVELRIPK